MRRTVLILGLLALADTGWAADCVEGVKPTKGVACTDPVTGYSIIRATDHAVDVPGSSRMLHDYSRRQAFNADGSRFLVMIGSGWWYLYNASTYAMIKKINSPCTGDAEIIWNPTDPDHFWFLGNNGSFLLRDYNIVTDAVTTVKDFTTDVQAIWPTAARVWTKSEGSPSADGRYWAFIAQTSAFGMLGFFTWDEQTDTILGSVTQTTSSVPDHISMSPTGSYVEIEWIVNAQPVEAGVYGRKRAYNQDLTDWTYIGCQAVHSDWALGLAGQDVIVSIDDGAGEAASPACSPADGKAYFRDIAAGWVSHGFNTHRVDLFDTYFGGAGRGVHISGRALSRPGYALFGIMGPYDGYQYEHMLVLVKLEPSATPVPIVSTFNSVRTQYENEEQPSINAAGTFAIFKSNWQRGGTADVNTDVYIVPLNPPTPDPLDISTLTLPAGTVGTAYSQTVAAVGGVAPRTFAIQAGALPDDLSMSAGGAITGTPSVADTFDFTVRVTDAQPETDDQVLSIVINAAALAITTTSLPAGTKNVGYSAFVEATGGTAPRTFAVQSGSLCTGLTLASTGEISGTPTVPQTCNFTIRATDNAAATDDQALSIVVNPGPIQVFATPGSTTAVVMISAPGLPTDQACGVSVTHAAVEVATGTSTSGASVRPVSIADLTASTDYTATVTCSPWSALYGVGNFTTRAAGGDSGTYTLNLRPAAVVLARMGPGGKAALQWKAPGEGSYTATKQVCTTDCTFSLTELASGVHNYYVDWETSAASVVASSAHRPASVPIP